jgi:hypothetical protein
MSALRPWAHVIVREGGERGRRTRTEDNGNAVYTWPHMAEIEKGERGMAMNGGDCRAVRTGKEVLSLSKRLTSAVSALKGDR